MTSIPSNETRRLGASRAEKGKVAVIGLVAVAMIAALMQFAISSNAEAGGPPYSGEQTQATGPAFFGPAPNPVPYCPTPVYFPPLEANEDPVAGLIPVGFTTTSTANGITLTYELTADGPDPAYPGFFDAAVTGRSANDQPKGVEMAAGDAATITLSEPLFYTQWVFTDVDRENEGFDVVPLWTDPANPGAVAVFGGDDEFDFTGTTQNVAQFNDSNPVSGEDSESINGRAQVDLLSAVNGITITRDPGSGQSGFAVGGGCPPIGVAKEVSAGPTWNGSSFDVEYTIRVRNNLPSTATLSADIAAARAAAATFSDPALGGEPVAIDLVDVSLQDLLIAAEFSTVTIVSNTNVSGNVATNPNYNGDTDSDLILPGETVSAETTEEFVLVLQYTPAPAGPLDPDVCQATFELLNSAVASGTAAGVEVTDESDEGDDADPGVDNGDGGVDDPTVVTFDCPPQAEPVLEIVKTVVLGPNGTCPDFDGGITGLGDPLAIPDGGTATYCISVRNSGLGEATNVVVTDPQAPADFDGAIGTLAAGVEATPPLSYDVVVTDATPTTNTATAAGDGPLGPLTPVTDDAVIEIALEPVLEIVKTVILGPAGTCPDFAGGVAGPGTPLEVNEGDTVTYCISVRNTGGTDATDVVVTDVQAPADFDGAIGTIAAGTEAPAVSYDVVITGTTPPTNTASVTGNGPGGPLDPVTDDAVIDPIPPPQLEIVKTVVVGPAGTCPDFAGGVAGLGTPLEVNEGDTVTYCISVRNTGGADATDVVVTDAQAPADFDGAIGTIAAGAEAPAVSYDVVIAGTTPPTNTASVTGNGPGGPLDPVTDVAVIDPLAPPELEIVKTVVAGPAGTCPDFAGGVAGPGTPLEVNEGDTVTYCISVRNVGEADATNVVVTDDQAPAGFDGAIGTIAGGAEAAVSYDIVVTSTTPPTNTAGATGDGPNGPIDPVTDDAVIDPVGTPVLEIVKTVVVGPNGTCPSFAAGAAGPGTALDVEWRSTVTYCISVRNTGDGDASNVVVTDPQAPAAFDIGTIAAGAEAPAVSYDLVADENSPAENVATARGDGPRGDPLDPVDDPALIVPPPAPVPAIAITKTIVNDAGSCAVASEGSDEFVVGEIGDRITWCFTVRNTGQTALTTILLDDPLAGLAAVDVLAVYGNGAPSLAVGDSIDFEFPSLVADDGALNIVDVTGVPSEDDGTPIVGLPDVDDSNTAAVGETSVTLAKTVAIGANADCATAVEAVVARAGDQVTYCFTITNTGSVHLLVEEVVDNDLGLSIPVLAGDQVIEPGGAVTVSTSLAATTLVNTAMVEGTPTDPGGTPFPGAPRPTANDDAEVTGLTPQLDIVKTVIAGPNGTCPTSVAGGVAGQGDALAVNVGDTVTYCINVINSGDVDIDNVVVSDAMAPADFDGALGTLAIGAEGVAQFDVVVTSDTAPVNTASVTGDDPVTGGQLPPKTDTAIIDPAAPAPAVTLSKTVIEGPNGDCATAVEGTDELVVLTEDDQITWCFVVTNTGNVPLANFDFDDVPAELNDIDILADFVTPAIPALPVGGVVSFSLEATIPAGGVDNVATVTGRGAELDGTVIAGLPEVDDENTAAINEAALEFNKTVVAGTNADCDTGVESVTVNNGDIVTYCFTVINTGGVNMSVTEVVDVTLGVTVPIPPASQILTPGTSVTVQISQASTGDIENTASATGTPVDEEGNPIPGDPIVPEDTAEVDVLEANLRVLKSIDDRGPHRAGTVVTYTFVVFNDGPDPAEDVAVVDTLPAGLVIETLPDVDGWACTRTSDTVLECAKATPLGVDDDQTFTYTATITAASTANVNLVNTVKVESSTPDPNPDDNDDEEDTERFVPPTTPTRPNPSLPIPVITNTPALPAPITPTAPPLAITGAQSATLAALAGGLLWLGGLFAVGAHRRRDDLD